MLGTSLEVGEMWHCWPLLPLCHPPPHPLRGHNSQPGGKQVLQQHIKALALLFVLLLLRGEARHRDMCGGDGDCSGAGLFAQPLGKWQ